LKQEAGFGWSEGAQSYAPEPALEPIRQLLRHGHTIPDGRFSHQKNGFRWRHVFHFAVTASTVCRSISDARPPAAGGRAICGHGLLLPSPGAHAILLQLMPCSRRFTTWSRRQREAGRSTDRTSSREPGIFPSGCHSLADNASPTRHSEQRLAHRRRGVECLLETLRIGRCLQTVGSSGLTGGKMHEEEKRLSFFFGSSEKFVGKLGLG